MSIQPQELVMFPDGTIDIIPQGTVIVVREEAGCMKDLYAERAAVRTALSGRTVFYFTMHAREKIIGEMKQFGHTPPANLTITGGVRAAGNLPEDCAGDLCIIDPFSSLFMHHDTSRFMQILVRMKEASQTGRSFLLLCDSGVLSPQHEYLLHAHADGIIRFVALTEGDRIKRYLHFQKLRGAVPLDKMIPFTVTYEGLFVDTRERLG